MKKVNLLLVAAGLVGGSIALANGSSLQVSEAASYYDENIIQSNITSECIQLGSQFSQSTAKYLEKKDSLFRWLATKRLLKMVNP